MPVAIADASPLIYLSAIDRFPLLRVFFERVLIPPAVWMEVVEQGEGKPGATEVVEASEAGWIRRVDAPDRSKVRAFQERLELGETEALAVALERPEAVLLIDEHAGRSIADGLDLRFTGTIGLLLQAKDENCIPSIEGDLDRLRSDAGFWITDTLYERVLQTAGEKP